MLEVGMAVALVCVFAYVACRGLDWVERELDESLFVKAHERVGRRAEGEDEAA